MTRERSEEVVLIALVASVAIHVGLMMLVKPQVMARVAPPAAKAARPGPMRVIRSAPRPDPVRVADVEDRKALKDAPSAVGDKSAPLLAAPSSAAPAIELPDVREPAETPVIEPAAVLDSRPVGLDKVSSASIPMTRIETPSMSASAPSRPDFSVWVPTAAGSAVPAAPVPGREPVLALPPARMSAEREQEAGRAAFTPAEEIYAKVDEKVVLEEKAAVRTLVNAETAADLVKFVNVAMTAAQGGDGSRYFKVMMTPRADLRTVPKDVVMVIDGSGSIGNDRLSSCRKAARRILRSCTNTGDRFNLVVFRNAFSYAFRSWRECDAESFAAGDTWLGKQTAHGRTDVFSTISSVLTLPRDPKRPLIALVVTDGDANAGVSDTAEILSRFTALNDGLVSVYMYGVKSSANRELIDVLTHGNRGESFVFDGWRWSAGEGMEGLSERFRDPVLTDLRVVFASGTQAEAYPRLLRNLYRGGTLEFYGRVPAGTESVSFSVKGLNGENAYEGYFTIPFATAAADAGVVAAWEAERAVDRKLGTR